MSLVQYAAAQILGAKAEILEVTHSEVPLACPSSYVKTFQRKKVFFRGCSHEGKEKTDQENVNLFAILVDNNF